MTKEELREEFYRIRKEEYDKAKEYQKLKVDDEFEAAIKFAEYYHTLIIKNKI